MSSPNLSRSLFLVTEPDGPHDHLVRVIQAGIEGGISHIVVRRPNASAKDLYDITRCVCDVVRDSNVQVLVSDRVDVAQVLPDVGAHLAGHSLPCSVVRPVMAGRLVGVSVHGRAEGLQCARQGADYLLFGHVYETASHVGEPGRGLDALREVARAVPVPVIAIGGITADRVDEALATGARGVAVIRALSDADDPGAVAKRLRLSLDRADYPHLDPGDEETS